MFENCFNKAQDANPEVPKTKTEKLREEFEIAVLKKQRRYPDRDYHDIADEVIREMKQASDDKIKALVRRTESVDSATNNLIDEFKNDGEISILAGMNPKLNAISLSNRKEGILRSWNSLLHPVYDFLQNPLYIPYIRSGHNPHEALLMDAWIKRTQGVATGNALLDDLGDKLTKYSKMNENKLKDYGLLDQSIEGWVTNPLWSADRLLSRFDGDEKLNMQFFLDEMWNARDRNHYLGWTREEFDKGGEQAFKSLIAGKVNYNESNNFTNRFSKERYFFIGDGEGWANLNRLFGSTTLVNTLHYNSTGMATYFATLEKFGANPTATMKNVRESILTEADTLFRSNQISSVQMKEIKDKLSATSAQLDLFASLEDFVVDRGVTRVISEINAAGRFVLGNASVINFIGNGGFLPQITQVWQNSGLNPIVELAKSTWLNPNLKQRKRMMADLDLLTSVYVHTSFRDFEDIKNYGFAKYILQGMYNTIGLHRAEEVFRQTGRLIMTNSLVNSLKDGDLLKDNVSGKLLRDYGFTEADANIIRNSNFTEGNFSYESLNAPPEVVDALKQKILGIVYSETKMRTAVPTEYAQYMYHTGGRLKMDAREGTELGAFMEGLLLLKKFPIANLNNSYKTLSYIPTNKKYGKLNPARYWDRLKYFGAVATSAFITGMLYQQVSNILAGKDPVDMTEWGNWNKSLWIGSGGNIAAMFVQNQEYDDSSYRLLAGSYAPVVDIVDAGLGYVKDKASGEFYRSGNAEKVAGNKVMKAGYRYLPYTNYMYTKAVLDHTLKVHLQEAIDPSSTIKQRRREQKNDVSRFLGLDGSVRMPDIEKAWGE